MRLLIPFGIVAAVGSAAVAEGQVERSLYQYEDLARRIKDCFHLQGNAPVSLDEIIATMKGNDDDYSQDTTFHGITDFDRLQRVREALKKCFVERIECRTGP